MAKEMYISSSPHETKVAVLEDDQLVEVYFERDTDVGLVGGIYKGRVSRVLPGMQSAFVDIGLERDAFLYVSDFYEDQEEYDKVFEEAEARATKFTNQQGQQGQSSPGAIAPLAAGDAGTAPPATIERAAPQAPPQVIEERSAPPSTPPASEAAPADQSAATTPSPTPVFTPHQNRESRDRRGFDPRRGRRRRNRGRADFRENRPADRRPTTAPNTPAETPEESHEFQILPGESLAKYRNAGPATGHEEATSTPESGYEDFSTRGTTEETSSAPALADEVDAAAVRTADAEPQNLDSVVVADEPMPFTPGAIYSHHPSVAIETVTPQATEPTASKPETIESASTPVEEEAASPAASGDISTEAQVESPSERAELEVSEEESESEEGELAEGEDLADETEDEIAAEAFEGQLDDQGGLPAELAAGAEGEQPAVAGTNEGSTGAPGDRAYTLRENSQRPKFAPRRRRGRRGTGGDRGPRRQDNRRDAPRSGGNHHPVQIAEVLKEGQEILVQIAKEPLGTKGARITSHVALPGRYLVYMPTISHIGVSRKIASEEERLRLRNIIQENKGSLTGGFIVRTASAGRSEEEFKADLKFLSTLWAEIRAKHDRLKGPSLIHRDLDLVQRLLRDLLTPDFKCVRVDSETDYERVLDFVNRCQPALVGKVKLYTRDTPLYEEFGIQAELDKALKPKVWLKSGGYIVINQTEALVAVDVNTGKFVGKTNRLEDTIVKTNVDAVNEIIRQVRLRDLGGIIVIDFIDMDERKNRAKVVQALEEALRSDRAPTKVVSFNDFGLVAITRKRVKQSLERTLCVPCAYCAGAGWVKSVNTVCNEILAEAKKMSKDLEGNVITLRVNPEVAKHLKSREGNLISELEAMIKKDIIVKGDPSVHQERFEIY
jgi:ribonuclease G